MPGFKSSHLTGSFLLTLIKSSPKKIEVTPSIAKMLFARGIFLSSVSLNTSTGPISETVILGINFNEFGFGVSTVSTSIYKGYTI